MVDKSKITDKFGRVQDLIVDLVFEPWSEEKVLELRNLLSGIPMRDKGDRSALIQRAMDQVTHLAEIEEEVERVSDPAQSAKVMRKLATGHDSLLEKLRSWFQF